MKKLWVLSLCVSVTFHVILLAGLPGLRLTATRSQKFHQLEILPQNQFPEKTKEKMEIEKVLFKKPPPFIEELAKKTLMKGPDDLLLDKTLLDAPAKEIIFSEIDMEKLMEIKKTPAYMNYYNTIRERIREKAYMNYHQAMQGVVYVSFIILNDGNLYHLNLLEKSTDNNDLLQAARKSIADAAPFPPFPQNLNYPKLHFNVSIHFKSN